MPANEDFLDRLWTEVVNIDPEGKWIARGIETCRPLKKGAYAKSAAALERLRAIGAAEDLGRVSRESRYSACFDLLCSIEDSGLSERKLQIVINLLNQSLVGKVSPPKSVGEFWESRIEVMLDPKDDGKWLAEMTKPDRCKGAFGDVGPAVNRLRKAGATFANLGCLTAWSRYEASRQALQLLAESGLLEEDSLDGLHEVFLGADPSGTEAGPKSWPLPKKPARSDRQKAGDDPTKPLWKVRSGQAVAISPDSKTVAVAGASGPVRLLDAATGKELLVCEGLKAHIYLISFSPDGTLVAAAQIDQWVTICDASTGKLVAKIKVSEDEVSGMVFSSNSGELIRSSWGNAIEVVDPKKGKLGRRLRPAVSTNMVHGIAFTPDARRLIAIWQAEDVFDRLQCTIWSWPDRTEIGCFVIADSSVSAIDVSHDGRLIAVPFSACWPKHDEGSGIRVIEISSGKAVHTIPIKDAGAVVFTPKGDALIVSDGDRFRIFGATNYKELFVSDDVGDVTGFSVSQDQRFLAVATSSNGAVFFGLSALLQKIGLD